MGTQLKSKKNGDGVKFDNNILRKAVQVVRAVNHDLRQQIVKLLDDNGRLTVTEIYVKLRLEQSVASQHLALLRRSGVVTTIRDGKFIYYSIDKERLDEIFALLKELVEK
ncbi:MAG: metalloregulator ArsR/SmtB family transcription factor [Chitinophagales bacterium]|nr:metalloregulator ArsR/SmtB family transcription factor [Chitinophagales bacterium]MCZ2394238.1 metalloregulator ArsR/SmtB family transcription factor [Chitinophagales bacterium]